jgi:hypothetical protein
VTSSARSSFDASSAAADGSAGLAPGSGVDAGAAARGGAIDSSSFSTARADSTRSASAASARRELARGAERLELRPPLALAVDLEEEPDERLARRRSALFSRAEATLAFEAVEVPHLAADEDGRVDVERLDLPGRDGFRRRDDDGFVAAFERRRAGRIPSSSWSRPSFANWSGCGFAGRRVLTTATAAGSLRSPGFTRSYCQRIQPTAPSDGDRERASPRRPARRSASADSGR